MPALLAYYRRQDPSQALILSSEDLCSVGPVAMIQDLTVAANLGITHAERNGHHYFAGTQHVSRERPGTGAG